MNNYFLEKDIEKVLISAEEIDEIVSSIADQINKDYAHVTDDVLLIGILKGGVFFLADLMRKLTIPCIMDFMAVSSYGGETSSSGEIKIIKDINVPLAGRHVIIVEDIIDTGLTLKTLKNILSVRGPKSVKVASFCDKPERRRTDIEGDYVGKKIPNEFVVGYGLDYDQHYRNLRYVGTLKSEVYEKK